MLDHAHHPRGQPMGSRLCCSLDRSDWPDWTDRAEGPFGIRDKTQKEIYLHCRLFQLINYETYSISATEDNIILIQMNYFLCYFSYFNNSAELIN